MNIFRKVVVLTMLLAVTAVQAEPAAWYKWYSKLNAHVVCSQTSPGEGWEQQPRAYLDARCERPKKS
ncbi:hypothetical protein ACO0LL_23570 [Undibacterium sp. TC4M20W]|jgi:hypothetical protein|uniref:hypothetical protein n=1 Tax=unclassified Undibacterium TaxID=2630295 RepID=UPI003BF3243E